MNLPSQTVQKLQDIDANSCLFLRHYRSRIVRASLRILNDTPPFVSQNSSRKFNESLIIMTMRAVTHLNKQNNLTGQNIELIDHPPYTPDLVPNDFFVLSDLKPIKPKKFIEN